MGTLGPGLSLVLGRLPTGAAVAVAGAAGADGGPSPEISLGSNGVAGVNRRLRFVAVSTGRGTLVESMRVRDGRVMRWGEIRDISGSRS